MSIEFQHAHETRFFGDNDELCIDTGSSVGLVKFTNVRITNWSITQNPIMHESVEIQGRIHRVPIAIDNSATINLTLWAGEAKIVADKGLIIPQKSFREATIIELLQLVNEKIDKR